MLQQTWGAIAGESAIATAVAATASLGGAAAPLLLGAILPIPARQTIALLGALGRVIGALLSARRTRWCLALLLGGAAVAALGVFLDIA